MSIWTIIVISLAVFFGTFLLAERFVEDARIRHRRDAMRDEDEQFPQSDIGKLTELNDFAERSK